MPKENRKRGKKHRRGIEGAPQVGKLIPFAEEIHEDPQPGPSWIVPKPQQTEEFNDAAPFGYVDAEVKAYFRTVDIQIRDWQQHTAQDEDEGTNPDSNEERHMFFVASLKEMSGKEKQLATDADCSNILERMSYSMDDFVRRVFIDRLAGSYAVLVKHRFASHVCQTMFTVATDTISREMKGIFPSNSSPDQGELRTLTQLILDVCQELLPTFTSLILDPFASHVLRALLLLLFPPLGPSTESTLRSKKSATFKARLGPMKSLFSSNSHNQSRNTPESFRDMAARFLSVLKDGLGENEVRVLASDQVASPVLQLLLQVEADLGKSDVCDSLMDRILVGIITACQSNPMTPIDPSPYISSLLLSSTSSHLFETLVSRAPPLAFSALWTTYFKGTLSRLAVHPVGNFVVSKAVERLTEDQLADACQELEGAWGKMIRSSRTGVLKAMIDRAGILGHGEKDICEAMLRAMDLKSVENHALLMPCVLNLMPLQDYKLTLESSSKPDKEKHAAHKTDEPTAPKTQGAILLQSLLRLGQPHNGIVLSSIRSLPISNLLVIAHNPTSSRILDTVLDSPTVAVRDKRSFVMLFIGHFHELVDGKIGSWIGEKCWDVADVYLKEKIAKSLIPHEQVLSGSHYGKYFARRLNLHLFQRRRDEWRNAQSQTKILNGSNSTKHVDQQAVPSLEHKVTKKRKRERPADEIDILFENGLGKKVKKGALMLDVEAELDSKNDLPMDTSLKEVLGAIKAVPKDG